MHTPFIPEPPFLAVLSTRNNRGWRLITRAVCGLILSALALRAALCSAEPKPKNTCEASYERAQVARAEGDLLGATDNLVSCAGVLCPDAMQTDCNRWLEEVRASVPTVVFRVVDRLGADVLGATVSIDGRPEEALNGRAIRVNPGPHDVTLRASGFSARSQHLQFVEGHQLRAEVVSLTRLETLPTEVRTAPDPRKALVPLKPTVPHGHRRHFTATQWAAGGVGIVGAVGFAYFGVKARNGDHDLDRCSPNCSKAAVSDVKRDYLYSNLSLAVSLAGIAVGLVQYLAQDTGAAYASKAGRLSVSVSPNSMQLQGSF